MRCDESGCLSFRKPVTFNLNKKIMKKLNLNLDDLKVESFTTTPGSATQRGTIHGYDALTNETHVDCCGWHTDGTCKCGDESGNMTDCDDNNTLNTCNASCYEDTDCFDNCYTDARLC